MDRPQQPYPSKIPIITRPSASQWGPQQLPMPFSSNGRRNDMPIVEGSELAGYTRHIAAEHAVQSYLLEHPGDAALLASVAQKYADEGPTTAYSPAPLHELASSQKAETSPGLEFRAAPALHGPKESELGEEELAEEALSIKLLQAREEMAREKLPHAIPVIQFPAPDFYCEVGGKALVDVVRIGFMSKTSVVKFITRDGTARNGVNYIHTEGTITFEAGDVEKQIEVQILRAAQWDTTLEFSVELSEEGLTGGVLGFHLWQTRIRIVDEECFPSNKFKEEILSDRISEIPGIPFLLEYAKLNWSSPVVKRGTIKMMLHDLFENAFFITKLCMNLFLIDVILNDNRDISDGDRRVYLAILTVGNFVPFCMSHWLAYRRNLWKVGGGSRQIIQRSLMRKFLNYDEESRPIARFGEVIMGMTRDTHALVADGYLNLLLIVSVLQKLVLILLFQLVIAPSVGDKEPKVIALVPVFIFPIILSLFLKMRWKATTQTLMRQTSSQNDLTQQTQNTYENYRLIADYGQRPYFSDAFEKNISAYNKDTVDAGLTMTNNVRMAPWLSIIFGTFYTMYGGMEIIDHRGSDDNLTLGIFLANLNVFAAVGDCWSSIYLAVAQLQQSEDSLATITKLLNLSVDTRHRMELTRYRRDLTLRMRSELLARRDAGEALTALPIDLLPILLKNLEVNYPIKCFSDQIKSSWRIVAPVGEFRCEQGQLVALVGPRGEGKSTILKLLGGVLMPDMKFIGASESAFLVPAHLRILHVSKHPMFFQASLLENLTFGVAAGHSDGKLERVLKICSMIGVSDENKAFIESGEVLNWSEVLSQTQAQMLSLSRAFITNPEILCIHKPCLVFDPIQSQVVLKLFKKFVRDRGLDVDEDRWHLRRPRTLIFTAVKAAAVAIADLIFHIDKQDGITNRTSEVRPRVSQQSSIRFPG